MQKHYLLLVLIAALVTGCVSTQTKPSQQSENANPFSAQGWGGTTCEELIHDITPSNVGFQQAVQNVRLYQSWASGFISGINYESTHFYDISGGTSPEETFSWLKEYCSENPKSIIPLALHKLINTWKSQGISQIKN